MLIETGERRVTTDEIFVCYWWWYDTVAILDEYFDSHEGVLPANEEVFVSQYDKENHRVLCDLKNHRKLEKTQLPPKRIHRIFLFCSPTPLQAEMSESDFINKTKKT